MPSPAASQTNAAAFELIIGMDCTGSLRNTMTPLEQFVVKTLNEIRDSAGEKVSVLEKNLQSSYFERFAGQVLQSIEFDLNNQHDTARVAKMVEVLGSSFVYPDSMHKFEEAFSAYCKQRGGKAPLEEAEIIFGGRPGLGRLEIVSKLFEAGLPDAQFHQLSRTACNTSMNCSDDYGCARVRELVVKLAKHRESAGFDAASLKSLNTALSQTSGLKSIENTLSIINNIEIAQERVMDPTHLTEYLDKTRTVRAFSDLLLTAEKLADNNAAIFYAAVEEFKTWMSEKIPMDRIEAAAELRPIQSVEQLHAAKIALSALPSNIHAPAILRSFKEATGQPFQGSEVLFALSRLDAAILAELSELTIEQRQGLRTKIEATNVLESERQQVGIQVIAAFQEAAARQNFSGSLAQFIEKLSLRAAA